MNFILFGEQYLMIKKRLSKLLKERLGEVDDFNVAKFDLDEDDLNEAVMEASCMPLGYDRKAVVFNNVKFLSKGANKKEEEIVYNLVNESNDSIDLFFIVRSDSILDSSRIVELIKQKGQIFNFTNIKKEDWPLFVKKYFKDRSVTIDNDAVEELINRTENDLNRFTNEADKLCLYNNHITLVDITLNVAKPIESDAFEMSNALFRGDNANAIAIYRDLQLLGSKATDSLIPMLGSQFRFFSEVCFLDSKGLSQQEIANELSCNPYRVKIALSNKRYVTRRQIAHALDDLYDLDYRIKSGQIDRFYGFELFLINFPN